MRVDVHTHILPEKLPDLDARYGCEGFVGLEHHCPGKARMMLGGNCFREIEANSWSPERRIEECDRDGVDVQVLSTVPVMFAYWARARHAWDLARLLNDHIAEIVRDHPRRFVGLASLPLQDPDLAIQELERSVQQLGLAGVQIGTHVNGRNLDDADLFPVLSRAAELGAAVFVHPWDMLARERMPKYWLPWLVGMPTETALAIGSVIFGGVLERLPELRIAFAHGGGSFPAILGRMEHGFRVRPDLVAVDNPRPPADYLGQFYLDSLVHDPVVLRQLIDLVTVDRIALGSDYPFPLGESPAGALIDSMADLAPQQRARMLGGTALEFLGLASAAFEES
ncbi:MAG: amidohydrolase [bacterium]|nr:amidohydrolase [bacterium]